MESLSSVSFILHTATMARHLNPTLRDTLIIGCVLYERDINYDMMRMILREKTVATIPGRSLCGRKFLRCPASCDISAVTLYKNIPQVLNKNMENTEWKCEVCKRDLMLHDSTPDDACLLQCMCYYHISYVGA